jgi:3-methyladenine DNA glycosylase AlkD
VIATRPTPQPDPRPGSDAVAAPEDGDAPADEGIVADPGRRVTPGDELPGDQLPGDQLPGHAASGEATAQARSFVAARRSTAETLGRTLADLTTDPGAFATTLRDGLQALADPRYLEGQQRVAPGIGAVHGVRWPLLAAVQRGFRRASRGEPTRLLLDIADRLFREETLEERWFAFELLERAVRTDPVAAWQLLRRGAREAGDWITVDTLAHPYGRGILAEAYRWAELDQLVFSPSRWERRLVGSTIATIPFVDRVLGREPGVAGRALPILEMLMGDDRPEVQKAIAWALRSLTLVDGAAVASFLAGEATTARATGDGHRAWVVRDALPKVDPTLAAELRDSLAGIRRRPGAPSTSRAAEIASSFTGGTGLPDPAGYRERLP